MKRIRTLIVGMSPEIGGVETLIIRLMRGMDHERFGFDILTFCPHCAFEEELKSLGCEVFHATRRGHNPVKNYFEKRHFFLSQSDTYNYVWLHVSSASDLKTILMIKKYTNAKVICHSHGISFESRGGLIKRLHLWLHYKNRPGLVANTDMYLACSRKAGEWLYGDIGDKLTVIPNGVDLNAFRYDSDKRELVRRVLGVQDKIAIGHVGRLTTVKNQEFLLKIFKVFHNRYDEAVLIIVGTGELEATLREQVRELGLETAVHFLGFRDDVPDLLQAFDIFALPSLFEGLPITLIEAQAGGLPCVISDTVTHEVAATELIHFVSLEQTPEKWADEMEAALRHVRASEEYAKDLSDAGYSIETAINIICTVLGGVDEQNA